MHAISAAELRLDIRAAINADDLDAAASQLNAAPEAWRRSFSLRMLEGELVERQGRMDEAIEIYRQLQSTFPGQPLAPVKLVWAYLKSDRAAEARGVFESAVWPGSAEPSAKARLLAVLAPTAAAEGADKYVDRLPEEDRREPGLMARVASAEARAGLTEKALARLESAAGPLPVAGEALRIDLLVKLFEFGDALEHARRAAAEHPGEIELVRRLLMLLERTRQFADAPEILRNALRRWPDDWSLLARLNNLPISFEQFSELFAIVRAGCDTAALPPRALMQYALAAIQVGDTHAGREALERIPDDGSAGQPLGPLKAVLDSRPIEAWTQRTRLVDDDMVNQVQVVRTPGARATLVVFSGLRNRCCQLPLAYADVLLADYPVNVIYLRAGSRGYMMGIEALGPDRPGTAEGLRALIASLGSLPVIVMGFSVGGFAATRGGAENDAKAVISFAGPTAVYSFADKPPEASLTFVRREAAFLPARERDVRPDVAEHPGMKVYHFHGADNPEDARQARRLEDLPNVEVIALEGVDDHLVGLAAIARGELDRVFSEILGDLT